MSSIAEIYTEAVYDNLKPLYGNWEPGRPVKLGDFGLLRGRIFIYLGNIEERGISFQTRTDPAKDQKYFSSAGDTQINFYAKGSVTSSGVVNEKARVEIRFSSRKAVFFNAAGCSYTMIADKVALGRRVMDLFRRGEWQREWAIVTDLVEAESTTLAVSGADQAAIAFEATSDVPYIDLADAAIGLEVKMASNIGYQVVAEKGLVPLFGLCKIQNAFLWWGDEFKPLSRQMTDLNVRSALEDSPLVRTEESDEALFFAQLQ